MEKSGPVEGRENATVTVRKVGSVVPLHSKTCNLTASSELERNGIWRSASFRTKVMEGSVSLDSLLEGALAGSGATSPQDAVVLALHSSLLAAGYECTAVGDEVS